MASSRFIIVDDHTMFRDALRQSLAATFADREVADVGTLDELTTLLADDKDTELIMLDLSMPGVLGFSGLVRVRTEHPQIPVMVVSGTDGHHIIRRCIDFGASGFVPKRLPIEMVRKAIAAVLAGDVWTPPDYDPATPPNPDDRKLAARLSTLTPQQLRVLGMLGKGMLNKQIAYDLNVSEATVKAHVSAILQKLDVDSRTQAVIAINRTQLVQWPGDQEPAD